MFYVSERLNLQEDSVPTILIFGIGCFPIAVYTTPNTVDLTEHSDTIIID